VPGLRLRRCFAAVVSLATEAMARQTLFSAKPWGVKVGECDCVAEAAGPARHAAGVGPCRAESTQRLDRNRSRGRIRGLYRRGEVAGRACMVPGPHPKSWPPGRRLAGFLIPSAVWNASCLLVSGDPEVGAHSDPYASRGGPIVLQTLTIQESFSGDHDRLDECFRNFRAWKRSDFRRACDAFKEFEQGLQRHIVWEEHILFPLFEDKTGMRDCGPTAVMRDEHRRIRAYLDAIHDKVRIGSPDSDVDEQQLVELLTAHNEKEERVLYPALDRLLSEAERADAFERMQAVPEALKQSCCGQHG